MWTVTRLLVPVDADDIGKLTAESPQGRRFTIELPARALRLFAVGDTFTIELSKANGHQDNKRY